MRILDRSFMALVQSLTLLLVAPSAFAVTEIQLWHSMRGEADQTLTDLTARFNAEHKDVHVTLEYKGTPAKTAEALETAERTKQLPDLVEIDDEFNDSVVGIAHPMNEVLGLVKSPDFNFFLPNTAAFVKDPHGRLLAFPLKASVPVLLYNRDAFAKYGLDPDAQPRTWRDLQKLLIAVQAQGQGYDCPYTTSVQSFIHIEDLASWHGETIATKNNGLDGPGAMLTFNDLLHVRHLAYMESWVRSKLFIVSGDEQQGDKRFASGECATLTTESDAIGDIMRTAKFPVGVAPLPFYEEGARNPVAPWVTGSSLWAMPGKKSEQYKAMAEYMAFLATPVAAAEWTQKTGAIPLTSAAFLASEHSTAYDATPGLAKVMQSASISPGTGQRGIRLPHFDKVHKVIDVELDLLWAGDVPAKEALDDAVRQGNEAMHGPEPVKAKPKAVRKTKT